MYCPQCRCEFVEWIGKCPCCKIPLVHQVPPDRQNVSETISYEALVDLVRKNGGKLKIEVLTTDVGKNKRWRFPYLGYGFAWAKRMQGDFNNILVYLTTAAVGMERKWAFPYMGYGYAWARRMRGYIGGQEFSLAAKKVGMERKWGFPYMGYGYAWIQEMSGECGHRLRIHLLTTEVRREKRWEFPYQGYGFAWADKGMLTLTLKR